jgi:C-terminal processing protease CtpA/Prc
MQRLFSALLVAFLAVWLGPAARAAAPPPVDARRTERLVQLCKAWGTVRYLHPYLAYKDVDWDAALVKALPKVRAAKDTQEYAAAVQGMLGMLGDPATRVVRRPPGSLPGAGAGGKPRGKELYTWVKDGVLAVHLSDPAILREWVRKPGAAVALGNELLKAKGVIIDLRGAGWPEFYFGGTITKLLVSREARAPAQRYLVHSGYRPQGRGSPTYYSAFETRPVEAFQPYPGAKGKRVAFLIDEGSRLPPLALALQQAGDGFLVVQGEVPNLGTSQQPVPLGEGLEARVRVTELVAADGGEASVRADTTVAAGADPGPDGPAFQAALGLLRGPAKGRKAEKPGAARLPPAVWRADKAYEDMAYPDAEHRLLALFRFWNVIHYFFPYKHLMDKDWDDVLALFVPKFEAAHDAREYALAVAEMATYLQDGHAIIPSGPELRRYFGECPAPIRLRMVEGVPVVTDVLDEGAAKGVGARVGDVVLKVDGEPVEERMGRLGKYVGASTPAAHKRYVLLLLLNGPDNSVLKLSLRGADGKVKEVELRRRRAYAQPPPRRGGKAFDVLPGNVGFVDLSRLTPGEVDAMFDRLMDTRAIVFDLRGYPQGTGPALAARLNVKRARYYAAFRRNFVAPGVLALGPYDFSLAFLQPIPSTGKAKYKGQTVTLIDERTQSQGEHTGLALGAACGTAFLGSPTAGANGDITSLLLPGGIAVTFSGQDVRHADGRPLQRVGLVPRVEARPTLRGVRAGKDEVLERALKYLREGK